jgi:hypothetical protein
MPEADVCSKVFVAVQTAIADRLCLSKAIADDHPSFGKI